MVKIFNAGGVLIGTFSADGAIGAIEVDFEAGGTVLVTDLPSDYSVQTFTASGYDRIEITNAGTSERGGTDGKFSLSLLTIETVDSGTAVELNFDLAITDADGDSVVTTDAINITIDPADPTNDVPPPEEQSLDGLSSMSLVSTDGENQQLQKTAANNNTVVLAAALAAAGMAATPAAAASDSLPAISGDSGIFFGAEQPGRVAANDDATVAGNGRSLLGNESGIIVDDGEGSSATAASPDGASKAKLVSDDSVPILAPTDLLSATDGPADGPAASLAAAMVVMPTAEALESLAGEAGAGIEQSGTLGKVLAEALEGGAGHDLIAAILARLPGARNGQNEALDALASPVGDAVPGRDMGQVGTFQVDALMNIGTDVAAFHHDAVQPIMNG